MMDQKKTSGELRVSPATSYQCQSSSHFHNFRFSVARIDGEHRGDGHLYL